MQNPRSSIPGTAFLLIRQHLTGYSRSSTAFSRAKRIACRTVLLGLIALCACTGSSEAPVSGIELLIAVNPTQPPQASGAACLDTPSAPAVTGPGVLVLDTVKLTGQTTDAQARCNFVALEAAPYAVLTDPNAPQGSRFIVSIPTKGKIQDWPSSLRTATSGPTDLLPPAGVTNFCPTKIAISSAGGLVAALDDPGVTDSGCATTNRAPRVIVWQRLTAPGQPLQPGTAFQYSPNNGPIAIAVSESTLFVLSPNAPNYVLTRYNLNTSNPNSTTPTLDQESQAQGVPLPPIPLGNTPTPTQTNLLLSGSNLFLSFGDANSGKVYQIGATANALPSDEFKINNQPIGIALNILSDGKVSDPTIQPAFAFILSDRVKFNRGSIVLTPVVTVRTATFTPDGFAWTLSSAGGLSQYDVVTLSNPNPTANAFLNANLNARDLAWIQRP